MVKSTSSSIPQTPELLILLFPVGKINRIATFTASVTKGVGKTFLCADEPLKTHLAYFATNFVLLVAACWGWFNFLGAQTVARGNVREASYLASGFTAFCIENNRLPTADEASGFSTRLAFVELRDAQYVYKCGIYSRDSLVIERDAKGRFQFRVGGNAFQ